MRHHRRRRPAHPPACSAMPNAWDPRCARRACFPACQVDRTHHMHPQGRVRPPYRTHPPHTAREHRAHAIHPAHPGQRTIGRHLAVGGHRAQPIRHHRPRRNLAVCHAHPQQGRAVSRIRTARRPVPGTRRMTNRFPIHSRKTKRAESVTPVAAEAATSVRRNATHAALRPETLHVPRQARPPSPPQARARRAAVAPDGRRVRSSCLNTGPPAHPASIPTRHCGRRVVVIHNEKTAPSGTSRKALPYASRAAAGHRRHPPPFIRRGPPKRSSAP